MRFVTCMGAIVLAAAPAAADVRTLKPAGWSAEQSLYTDAWTFTSPDGRSEAQVHYNTVAAASELADMAKDHMQPYGTDPVQEQGPSAASGTPGALVSAGAYRDDDGNVFMATSGVFPHKLGGHLVCHASAPLKGREAPPVLSSFLSACEAFARAGTPYDAGQARIAAQRAEVAKTPVASGKGRAVEAYLFAVHYIGGFGGYIYPDYRPIVLFKDGTACRCLDLPPAEIDPSVIMKSRPDDVTRWIRKDGQYVMTWPGETEPDKIDADQERPRVYKKGATLDGYWKRVGGGGNLAAGGSVSVAVSSAYRFYPDGTFSTETAVGSSAPGVVTAGQRKAAGRYAVGDNGLLELTWADGRTERTSLFHGEGAEPVLWIGGDSFTP